MDTLVLFAEDAVVRAECAAVALRIGARCGVAPAERAEMTADVLAIRAVLQHVLAGNCQTLDSLAVKYTFQG